MNIEALFEANLMFVLQYELSACFHLVMKI